MKRIDFTPDQSYEAVFEHMNERARAVAAGGEEAFFVGDHATTVTLGRSLKSRSQVMSQSAHIVEVERGGGATMHNPGQVVAYPLLRLADRGWSPVSYLRQLESLLISALAEDHIEAYAEAGKTGVWVGPRKIASLGVSLIDGVTRHGLALNVTNDLADFALITPCGFSADTMISVASLRPNATFVAWKDRIANALNRFSV